MKTIGFVSLENLMTDRNAWSGTLFKICEGIQKAGFNVKWIRVNPPIFLMRMVKLYLKIRYGFTTQHPLMFKLLAKYTDWNSVRECDYLFFSGNAQIMNYSPIKKKYIYYSDACFIQMVNYYWFNMPKSLVSMADIEERMAINKAFLNLRSSRWASDCATTYYDSGKEKTHVLKFGANIDDGDINSASEYKSGKLRILFSGVEWERKGGDVAVNTVQHLRSHYGLDVELFIVGIRQLQEKYKSYRFINHVGFLNKNNASEYNSYVKIIKNCHLLLLPTRAECAGIVFCEASAYGLPIFTYDTGGIGDYVINGVNGLRLAMDANYKNFAEQIYLAIENKQMAELHQNALKMYREQLNWNVWSQRFKSIMDNAEP